MTSSFKRHSMPAFPCILTAFLHISGSWQGFVLALSPQICLPLLFSNPPNTHTPRPHPPSMPHLGNDTVNVRFHQAAIPLYIRCGPNLTTHSHMCFFYSPIWHRSCWHYWSLVRHSDANSCWWPFPFSVVVTWLCQSECLMSGESVGSSQAQLLKLTYLFFPLYDKWDEATLTSGNWEELQCGASLPSRSCLQ